MLVAFPSVGWLYRSLSRGRKWLRDLIVMAARFLGTKNPRWGPPKGTISCYDLACRQEVEGRVVLEKQSIVKAPSTSLRAICKLEQQEFQPWPIFWSRHSQARLVGNSLALMDDQKRVCLEALYKEHSLCRDSSYRYLVLPKATELSGNWTSMISYWSASTNFYHWFTDGLPRLAVLSELPADVKVLVPAKLRPFQVETLRWLGLEARYRPTSERHLVIENYYFSSPVVMTGCDSPYSVQFLRRAFLDKADRSYHTPSRFYLQRIRKTRGVVNEEQLVAFFQEQGWAIVDPEQLTLAQQIQLFANATAICGLHGAGFTNLLWVSPGCKVLELVSRTYMNGCFEGIAQYVGADYRYLLCEGDAADRAFVPLSTLQQILEQDGFLD